MNAKKWQLIVFGLMLLTAVIYWWVVTAGLWTRWVPWSERFQVMADAFLAGQTHLTFDPAPALLALPDPYDDAARRAAKAEFYGDGVLFNGKYYMYWGPLPGLLVALIRAIGIAPYVSDTPLVFIFMLGAQAFATLLVLAAWRRFYPAAPRWTVILGILVMVLNTAMLWLLARPAVYEAAIAGGQCFLLGGFYLAVIGLERERPCWWRLALAGLCWACAVASRVSLAPAIVWVAAVVFWQLWRRAPGEKWLRFDWRNMAALLIPLAIGGMALATYNYVRFGSPLEFGYKYQVNDFNGPKLAAEGVLISGAYVWPNLYSYFLRPVMWIRQFPFMVEPFYMPNAFPADFTLPARYFVKEPTTGILKVAPFIWLAIVPVVLAAWRRRPVGAPAGRSVLWLVVGLLGAAGLAAVGPMQLVSSTNRYLADFVPCLVMLAVIGMWQLHVFVVGKKWLNRLFKTLVGAAGAYTCLAGLLLAVSGEQDHFSMHNPKWMKTMKQYTGCLQAPAVHTDPRPPLYPVAGDLWVTPGRDGFYWSDGMRWMALQQPMEFRITFVEPSKSEIEPIIVAGRPGASDVIYVRYMPGHRVTFGHNHTGRPANEGVTFTIMPNRPYRVDMDLDQANGVLTIALEGQMVYGARADFFPFARRDLLLGKNPGRFEPAGSEFAGTITPAN